VITATLEMFTYTAGPEKSLPSPFHNPQIRWPDFVRHERLLAHGIRKLPMSQNMLQGISRNGWKLEEMLRILLQRNAT